MLTSDPITPGDTSVQSASLEALDGEEAKTTWCPGPFLLKYEKCYKVRRKPYGFKRGGEYTFKNSATLDCAEDARSPECSNTQDWAADEENYRHIEYNFEFEFRLSIDVNLSRNACRSGAKFYRKQVIRAAWCSTFSCLETSQTRDSAGFQVNLSQKPNRFASECIYRYPTIIYETFLED
ncbi:hypothetical protein CSKR_110750 [Clonorchis sinensis]|uniref:Uncharacterized protein n=1 Tax=Clonorchis sinensis TaxID=79923 RepID=A0A419Q1V6_CLOSI|nr:hypothetical protein CSKR_110750 [Clonorchis sinensis]